MLRWRWVCVSSVAETFWTLSGTNATTVYEFWWLLFSGINILFFWQLSDKRCQLLGGRWSAYRWSSLSKGRVRSTLLLLWRYPKVRCPIVDRCLRAFRRCFLDTVFSEIVDFFSLLKYCQVVISTQVRKGWILFAVEKKNQNISFLTIPFPSKGFVKSTDSNASYLLNLMWTPHRIKKSCLVFLLLTTQLVGATISPA